MHVKIWSPLTLTFTSDTAFRFQYLCLGFEKFSQLQYQLSYTFNILHTHALGQDLSMHIIIWIPVTLTLTLDTAFRFQNLRLGFRKKNHNSNTNTGTPFIFHTRMPKDKTFPCMSKF